MSSIQCIKTGCQAYIEQYDEYVYGDAFEIEMNNGFGNLTHIYIFRICERSFSPINGRNLHFKVHNVLNWFDENDSQVKNSTLIASSVDNYGYEGKDV